MNQCKEFEIKFPTDHATHKKLAKCCVGCIDGMLVWTHQPTLKDCKAVGISQSKFWCFQKSKYGLNFQAICDVELCFLDICIRFAGASSDLLAVKTSNIKDLLDKGLLKPGLCIFGNNAYVNGFYTATPFLGLKRGQQERCAQFLFLSIKDQSRMCIWSSCPAMGILEEDWFF